MHLFIYLFISLFAYHYSFTYSIICSNSGHIDFRDPSGPQRTPKSDDGTCHVVLTCLADIFSLKYYFK